MVMPWTDEVSVIAKPYRQAQLNAFQAKWNWIADSIHVTLHTTSYALALDTDAFVSNLTNEVAAGLGYSTGGVVLSTLLAQYTPANRWGLTWAASTAYSVGDVLQQGGGLYRCTTAGTSAASIPTFGTTVGGTTTDNTVTWTYTGVGSAIAAVSTAYTVENVVRPATGNGYLYRCAAAGTSGASAPTWGTVVGETTTDGGVIWENVGSGVTALWAAPVSWASASFTMRYAVISDRTPGTAATQPLIAVSDFGTTTAGGGTFQINWNAQGICLFFDQ